MCKRWYIVNMNIQNRAKKYLKFKIHYSLVLFIAICILSANFVWAQKIYYIDYQNGNDKNDGLSKNTAWESHMLVSADKFYLVN